MASNRIKVYSLIALFILFSYPLLHSQSAVKVHESVEIGGIKQWIGAKGNDADKPVLLFLHGGPGFSSRAYSKKIIKFLKEEFIVVQWDQRGTGITAAWNPTPDALKLDMFYTDTEEVVRSVLNKFSKQKLYLVGFSWGGYLGLQFASKHPELLHAYISVSSMINGLESERRILAALREKVLSSDNKKALEEVSSIEIPFRNWKDLYFQRKWANQFLNGGTSKGYPASLFEDWSTKWFDVFTEVERFDAKLEVSEINCPIYFFLSRNDFVSHYEVAEEYYQSLSAKKKEVIWFEHSIHEIPSDEPKKFSEEVIKIKTNH